MPADDGLELYDDWSVRPPRPKLPEPHPQHAIKAVQCGARMFPFEHGDLLAKREDFERCIRAATEKDPASCRQCQ
jgi:hypothetical protein